VESSPSRSAAPSLSSNAERGSRGKGTVPDGPENPENPENPETPDPDPGTGKYCWKVLL
jgi:hypothetical protein